jgi:hypothetical protein
MITTLLAEYTGDSMVRDQNYSQKLGACGLVLFLWADWKQLGKIGKHFKTI